jgi:hypothetical protein
MEPFPGQWHLISRSTATDSGPRGEAEFAIQRPRDKRLTCSASPPERTRPGGVALAPPVPDPLGVGSARPLSARCARCERARGGRRSTWESKMVLKPSCSTPAGRGMQPVDAELHANCFGALCLRPEFNDIGGHAPIGVTFAVANENCGSPVFKEDATSLLFRHLDHHNSRNVVVAD